MNVLQETFKKPNELQFHEQTDSSEQFIGQLLAYAMVLAKKSGFKWRVTTRESQIRTGTDSYDPKRINFVVKHQVVKGAYFG